MFVYHCIWSLGHATDDYFLTANLDLGEILFLQVFILFNTYPVTVFGSGCQLHKQFSLQTITYVTEARGNGQQVDLTKHLFRNLLLLNHSLGCLKCFALKTRNPSTNPEHSSNYADKQKVIGITQPLRNPISRTPSIKELCTLQPI